MSDGACCHYCRSYECRCHYFKTTHDGPRCELCGKSPTEAGDTLCMTLKEWMEKEKK